MQNVEMTVSGTGKNKKLTIVCNLGTSLGKSKSGNSELFASTKGNVDVPGGDGLKLGLNLYKPV